MIRFIKFLRANRNDLLNRASWQRQRIRCKRYLILLLQGVWAIPFVFAVRMIRPLILVRFGIIDADRIGQFASSVGCLWANKELMKDGSNIIDWYAMTDLVCNKQLALMASRNLNVNNLVGYLDYWNRVIPGGAKHQNLKDHSEKYFRNMNGNLDKIKPMTFLPHEGEISKAWLRKHGWQEGKPFVCLIVRDSSYLRSSSIHKDGTDYSYHDYRDSDISTYTKAMEWLADNGVLVIRMGRIMEKRLVTTHSMVVDYAFNKDKNDLLDVWLFAHCNLCISTGVGPDWISDIFRRPILLINHLNLNDMISWSNSINYPKQLEWIDSGRPLSLTEYLKNHHSRLEDFVRDGIRIVDLSSEEIYLTVQEAWRRIQGKWKDNKEDIGQQEKAWKIFKGTNEFSKKHEFIHQEARFSSIFLRNNPNFIE